MEKVVGDMFSNSAKQIEPIMKKIMVNRLAVTGYHLQPVLPAKTDSSEMENGSVSDSRPQEASDANEKIDILYP
ncbi:hypothetical protein CQW23_28598 [Capsicum baccatum]|uniref:Uncharacterized protein n=1 Tax=Capsicum baccatum TaxID=33114 RepID=A0A2G2VGZ6_CAPBA|nr:hypothetical protein CQW23_28598 [Capsicum baccatum]